MKAKTVQHEDVTGQKEWYITFENETTGKRWAMKLAESTIKKIKEVENDTLQGTMEALVDDLSKEIDATKANKPIKTK